MDIHEDELKTVFKVLDVDGSGEISYMEFCQEIYKIRTRDVNTMLSFMKIEINEVNRRITKVETSIDEIHNCVVRGAPPSGQTVTQQTLPAKLFSDMFPAPQGAATT